MEKFVRFYDYRSDWSDATVKRFIRECDPFLSDLFVLVRCKLSATSDHELSFETLEELESRIDQLNSVTNVAKIVSPLNGNEIMECLNVGQGAHLREAKDFLVNLVIDGVLAEGDKEAARKVLLEKFSKQEF